MTHQPTSNLFSDNWSVYQKVLSNNYMLHQQFREQTGVAISRYKGNGPIRILDMGCGDAVQMVGQLKTQPVYSYTGHDMSPEALAFADANLKNIGCPYQLKLGPMQDLIKEEAGGFDIIYTSFAMHHLEDHQKVQLLRDCFDKMNDYGMMILIDIFRKEDSTREEYIDQYFSMIKEEWVALDEKEKQLIYDHISAFDHPATLTDMISWAQETGFSIEQFPIADDKHFMLVLNKV
jgi:ubiquinone/menaquinone biosynthesis C-methylase UbiE